MLGTGVATISGDTTITKDGTVGGACCQNNSTGTLNLKGGTIQVGSKSGSNVIYNYSTGTINVDGATIENNGKGSGGQNYSTGKINVKNAKIEAVNASGLNNANGGTLTVTGGTIKGNFGIFLPETFTGTTIIGIATSTNLIPHIEGSNNAIDTQGKGVIYVYSGYLISNGNSYTINIENTDSIKSTTKLYIGSTSKAYDSNSPTLYCSKSGSYNIAQPPNKNQIYWYSGQFIHKNGMNYDDTLLKSYITYRTNYTYDKSSNIIKLKQK